PRARPSPVRPGLKPGVEGSASPHPPIPPSQLLLGVGLALGVVVTALTGWVVALVVLPLAAVGLPVLLTAPPSGTSIAKLEALVEWTRALAGVLTLGVG